VSLVGGDPGYPCLTPARVRGVAQGQEGDFPLGRRARECARGPTSVPARQPYLIGRAGVAIERVAAQRRKREGEEEWERMTHRVHQS
jgi:hypothetical protein